MKIKQILTTAIIAVLPLGANAAYTINTVNAPATVAKNGTVTLTTYSSPYQTATIEDYDDEHIASTAYVKGAYNDTIAAINKTNTNYKNDIMDVRNSLQNKIINLELSSVVEPEYRIMGSAAAGREEFVQNLDYYGTEDCDADCLHNMESSFVSEAAVIAGIRSQRAEVWTTWEDDSAKTEVAFVTATE